MPDQPRQSGGTKHVVTVSAERSQCGAPGHRDLVATCSCGWTQRHNHGDRNDVSRSILYHRIAAIEAAIGAPFEAKWERGT